jgi:D-alanyl-D-alanine carboxypeptidase
LNKDYVPPDLVSTANGGPAVSTFGLEAVGAAEVLARRGDPAYSTLLADAANASIRRLAYADFVALRGAATAAGVRLVVLSAYRSFNLQVQTFNYWVSVGGYEQALRTSARPGHSEHQLGTVIDFGDGSAAPWEYADWATTATGAWLAAHAAEYGWVLSFPKGKTDVTCYDYEPWHYRYVGKDLARAVSDSRVTLREYQSAQLR